MRKIIFTVSLVILTALPLIADDIKTIKIDGVRTDDKFKLGLTLGYPTGLTAGLRTSDRFELNFVLATHYSDLTLGVSPLFTFAQLDIGGELFPLSIGPAVYFSVDWKWGVDFDILALLRMEYSFDKIPLNLYIEGGGGIKIDVGTGVQPQGSGAFGIRYIF